ncbi:MAG TPA: hypothetical protein VFK54_02660 [Candidatus Limnocylindrales bacterium]|nr:hypothetical protein [Candidatus Limnocylindrales bacterium]
MHRSIARRVLLAGSLASALSAAAVAPALAHDHYAGPAHGGTGQVLANGGNHPKFLPSAGGTYTSCESNGPVPGDTISNAWYGLETAHHGPDSGDPGKRDVVNGVVDRCYTADGNPATSDDQNPAIR